MFLYAFSSVLKDPLTRGYMIPVCFKSLMSFGDCSAEVGSPVVKLWVQSSDFEPSSILVSMMNDCFECILVVTHLPHCFRWESYQPHMATDTSVCADKKTRYGQLKTLTTVADEIMVDQGCNRLTTVHGVGNKQV